MAAIVLRPEEIDALRAGTWVTKTYPEPFPRGPPPLLPEDFEAMRQGRSVTMMREVWPAGVLSVGDVLGVLDPTGVGRPPPTLTPEELAALQAGETLTRTPTQRPPPGRPLPDLQVKVVEYRHEGSDHIYTFEAIPANATPSPPGDVPPPP